VAPSGALALLLGAGAAAIAPAGPDALLAVKAAAADSTEVAVAFVVDFGTGSAQGVLEGCVKVPSSDTGYDALAAFVQQAGLSEPSYNSAGLLCSIGGVPSSGCGVASNGEYIFWSYWHGTTGTWQYSSTGAFSLATNDVEGWRFQNPGPDNATAPHPGQPPTTPASAPLLTSRQRRQRRPGRHRHRSPPPAVPRRRVAYRRVALRRAPIPPPRHRRRVDRPRGDHVDAGDDRDHVADLRCTRVGRECGVQGCRPEDPGGPPRDESLGATRRRRARARCH